MNIGTTFDYEQALNLGLDPKIVLHRILELKLSPIRIGIKWSKVETEKRKYYWKEYDNIINTISKEKVPILLSIGMKAPRWPEFFIPDWLLDHSISSSNNELKGSLFQFLESVLLRYGDNNSIKWLQLENEAFLASGPGKLSIPYEFLLTELEYVKKLTYKPIMITAQGLPTTGVFAEYLKGRSKYKEKIIDLADIVGLNIYPIFEEKTIFGIHKTFRASKAAWKYFENLVNKIKINKKEFWIAELQAEPWQLGDINLNDAYANKTCTPELVSKYLKRVEELGFENVLLWGTEFHIACEEKGNSEWIDKVYD